jgi:beta-lactamase class D/beta-lactamase class D OXA-1
MKRIFLTCLLIFFCSPLLAAAPNTAAVFENRSGCFIVYDVQQAKRVFEYNAPRCKQAVSPTTTFPIPLSLMAFDQRLITQSTLFKWNGANQDLPSWDKDQTPYSWLKHSAIWVSQELAQRLGLATIQRYLGQFHYGNQDFSGDPGKNNGLTNAWLSSSLKISADQQLEFLLALYYNQLPVSREALLNTKQNLYLETSKRDWMLFGKTGSGYASPRTGDSFKDRPEGWFVGYIEKPGQAYIFVLNFTEPQPAPYAPIAGETAKNMALTLLSEMQLY